MDKEEFIKIMRIFSKIQPKYAPDFDKVEVCWFWYQEFKHLSAEKLRTALTLWVRNKDHFPSISEINKELSGESNLETIAKITAMNLMGAVRKYGYPNWDLAEKYIGSLGSKIVDRFGGWPAFCDMADNQTNQSFFINQLSDMARTYVAYQKIDNALPGGRNESVASLIEGLCQETSLKVN